MPRLKVFPPYEERGASAGCWSGVAALAGVGWAAVAVRPSLVWLAVLLTFPLGQVAWDAVATWRVTRAAMARRRESGIRGLLVYSQSPNWQAYIEREWLPRIGGRLDVLDWSQRKQWQQHDYRVQLYQKFLAAEVEFNPAAVIFREGGAPLVFRFYPAFRNAKHGNTEGLKDLEERFFRALEE